MGATLASFKGFNGQLFDCSLSSFELFGDFFFTANDFDLPPVFARFTLTFTCDSGFDLSLLTGTIFL